jgi:hypothetical protein
LVRLLGQIRSNKKRVTFSDETDDIIEILNDEELERPVTALNFSLLDVDDQIREMEGEIKQAKFETQLKLSSDKRYSNSVSESSKITVDEANDMDVYEVTTNLNENRRIEVLTNLSLTLGNLFFSNFNF